MKTKLIVLVIALIFTISLTSCTENQRAKQFGGNMTVNLPKGQKLINVTWKNDNAWYLTRPMAPTDIAESYSFNEESSFGIWEGTITLKESK
jgi:hypothetical protein